ncbi:MAG: hypothetical protein KF729_25505 [Sandaracinaceae bacterium]|nr:hypothetical protein [Sandaracinaceae bacterium]
MPERTGGIEALDYGGERGALGAVTVPVTASEVRLLNVVVDLDGSGTIAPYAVPDGTQEEWVVRNLPVAPGATSVTAHFELLDPARDREVELHATYDTAPRDAAPGLTSDGGTALHRRLVMTTVMRPALADPADGYVGQGAGGDPNEAWTRETPGDVDVPGGLYRAGLPHVPQAVNSCVLHSIAANLAWLARIHDFPECLTNADQGFGVDSSETIHELGYRIGDLGGFAYEGDRGVLPSEIFPAKNRLVAALDLPITSEELMDPSFEAIAAAMRQGCVVEIVLTFEGLMGRHMTALSGFADVTPAPGMRFSALGMRDGATSSFNDVYSVRHDGGGATLQGFPFRGRARAGRIESAIVQCPMRVDAVTLDYAHGAYEAGTVVRMTCVFDGVVSDVEPGCDGRHLHGAAVVIKDAPATPDRAPMNCGHGRVAERPVREVGVVCCPR